MKFIVEESTPENPTNVYIYSAAGWNQQVNTITTPLQQLSVEKNSRLVMEGGNQASYLPLVVNGAGSSMDILEDSIFILTHGSHPAKKDIINSYTAINVTQPELFHIGGSNKASMSVRLKGDYVNYWSLDTLNAANPHDEKLFQTVRPTSMTNKVDNLGGLPHYGLLASGTGATQGALSVGKDYLTLDTPMDVFSRQATGQTINNHPGVDTATVSYMPYGKTQAVDKVATLSGTSYVADVAGAAGVSDPILAPESTVTTRGFGTLAGPNTKDLQLGTIKQKYFGIWSEKSTTVQAVEPIITKHDALNFGTHTLDSGRQIYPLDDEVDITVLDTRPSGNTWYLSLKADPLVAKDAQGAIIDTIYASSLIYKDPAGDKGLDSNPVVGKGNAGTDTGIHWDSHDKSQGVVLETNRIHRVATYSGSITWTLSGSQPGA